MFESQFGLRENPFAAGHQSRFVYPSREHQEALAHLRFGIENREPFVLITGEVGTGKTTALYDVLGEYESRAVVALITNSALTRDEMLEEICLRFGLPSAGKVSKPQALVALEAFLMQTRARGQHAVLILDEAQNLERNLLEEIRLLSNLEDHGHKMIQIFLVGQPELEEHLAQPELRQLRQRITVFYRLSPLSLDDTERYIHHRISVAGGHALTVFPADACREVFEVTHGIPREINTVAGQAMLNAYVEDSPVVKPEHVRTVERDSEFKSVLRGGGGGARISTLEATAAAGGAGSPGVARTTGGASAAGAAGGGSSPGAKSDVEESKKPVDNAAMSGSNEPHPPSGPPPLIPAEPPASAASESAPSPAPAHGGPPPLHPGEPATAPPARDPVASASKPATHSRPEPPAASSAVTPPNPPASAAPGAPPSPTRRPGAPAPAGTAQDWGTWLSSLAQLPSTIDENLADDIAAVTQGDAGTQSAESPAAPAPSTSQAAPTPPRVEPVRAQVSTPPAPPRVEPPARTEVPTPFLSRAESAPPPPPRVDVEPVGSAVGPASTQEKEVPAHADSAHDPAWSTDHAESHHEVPSPAAAESTSGTPKLRPEQWLPDWGRTPRRLEFVEEEPPAEGAKSLRLMLVAGVIAVVAIGTIVGVRVWRSGAKQAQTQAASAVNTGTTPVDPSVPSPTSVDPSTSSATPAPVVTPPAPTPAPAPARGAHSPATSAQTSPTTVPATGQRTTSSTSTQSAPRETKPSSATSAPVGTQVGGSTGGGTGTGAAGGAAVGGAAAGGASAAGASGGAAAASGGAGVSGASAGAQSAAGASPAGASSSSSSPSAGATSTSANSASAGSAPAAASQGSFGIAVGQYLFEERAEEERAKLSASTNLPVRVVTVTEADETVYRLVLGSYDSRKAAERAASGLIERGLVDEARVVPLSSTTASKQ